MTPRIHQTGRDNWTGSHPPISDADRIARHGPLLPMERPAGEPPIWKAVSLLAALVVIVVIGSAVLP